MRKKMQKCEMKSGVKARILVTKRVTTLFTLKNSLVIQLTELYIYLKSPEPSTLSHQTPTSNQK